MSTLERAIALAAEAHASRAHPGILPMPEVRRDDD